MTATLDDLAAALGRIESRLAEPPPLLLKVPAAAARLSVHVKTLEKMISRGEVKTATIGKRQMVPMAELERLATPDEVRPAKVRQQQVKAWKPLVRRPPPPPSKK